MTLSTKLEERIALVDGDILLYRCGFAAEKRRWEIIHPDSDRGGASAVLDSAKERDEWLANNQGPDWITVLSIQPEPIANAIHNIHQTLQFIETNVACTSMTICLSDTETFRDRLAVTLPYKGNRDPDSKPYYYDKLRQYLLDEYDAIVWKDVEADDVISVCMRSEVQDIEYVACSVDKDLQQIKGWHYNWVKDELFYIDKVTAARNFWMQMLQGDPTDNVQGIKGIGPAKARKLLKECSTLSAMFDKVSKTYKEKGLTTERFWENYNLLKLLETYNANSSEQTQASYISVDIGIIKESQEKQVHASPELKTTKEI